MGLALLRTQASNVTGTYTPVALLSDYFELSLAAGSVTIAPATSVGLGQLIAIKCIFPTGTTNLAFDAKYLIDSQPGSVSTTVGNWICYGFFWDGTWFQRVWSATGGP